MEQDLALPRWIEDEYDQIRSCLGPDSARSADRFRSEYTHLLKIMAPLPAKVEMFEIYKISMNSLHPYFQNPFVALAHCCEYMVGYWFYRHAFKMKAFIDGLANSMESGNWLMAVSCLRHILEESSHFDFYLSKIERSVKKIEQLEKNEAKRIKQGKRPSDKWIEDYIACDLHIVTSLEKAACGSDFDWATWVHNALKDTHSNAEVTEFFRQSSSRKTHINDCISHMEKVHGKPFSKYYDLLSEMVHPNFGSNTLVLVTREKLNDVFGRVWLARSTRTQEAAGWFFEIVAEPMTETFAIATRNISASGQLFALFQKRAAVSEGSTNRFA